MNNVLALSHSNRLPATLAQTLTELPFGSQSQVQTAQGRISAFLGYAGYDRTVGVAKYALRVLNNSPRPARARLYIEVRGVQQNAYPLAFDIAPYSMRDDMVPVRLQDTGPFDRAIVEVRSEDTYFTVEAPPPPPQKRQWKKWCAAAFVPIAAACAIDLSLPRVLAIAAPTKALAGTSVQVPFQVSGVGSIEYDWATRDGLQLAAGLASRSDVLKLPVPAHGDGAPYTLHVRMRNPFFNAEQSATVAVTMPRRLPTARPRAVQPDAATLINDLTVSPSPVHAGDMVSIKYVTQAQSGDVWLVGMDGRTWARAPLSTSGVTELSVPQPTAGHDMRVVLHAQRGKTHAESSVGLTVLPSAAVASDGGAGGSAAAPQAKPASAVAPTLTLDSTVVSPGDNVVVRVSGTHGDVKITVMSAAGSTVEQGSVSQEDGAISITAPTVSSVTTFYVVATFTAGVSEQSIVRRLVVTPR
jgi:hypothetical protein